MPVRIFAAMLAFAASLTAVMAADAPVFTRAQSVINAYQIMCTLELPNFAHLDAKAIAMQMQVRGDTTVPSGDQRVVHSKAYGGDLKDGAFLMMIEELTAPDATVTSCAIGADVPDRDAFRADAVHEMKLPEAPPPEIRDDGSRSFEWPMPFGPGTTFILRDFQPSGKPGVMLKLIVKKATPAGRNASMINAFLQHCAREPPGFDKIEAQAVGMKLAVLNDVGQSQKTGTFAHSKSWTLPTAEGLFEWNATETNGQNAYINVCAIAASDVDAGPLKSELVAKLKLAPPSSSSVSPDDTHAITVWDNFFGPGTRLMFVDQSPKNQSGAIISYMLAVPPRP